MKNEDLEQTHQYNQTILNNIRTLCVFRATSIPKIEKALGYGNGSVSGWNKAKKRAPMERVESIANYFGVSVDYLTTEHSVEHQKKTDVNEFAPIDLSTIEKVVIDLWRRSAPDKQDLAISLLRSFAESSADPAATHESS